MKYELVKKPKNIVELEVSLTPEEWKAEVDEAYNRTKGKYNVEGFRKGKAPRKVIESIYGPSVFYEDALTEAFGKAYDTVIAKEKDLADYFEETIKDVKDVNLAVNFITTSNLLLRKHYIHYKYKK